MPSRNDPGDGLRPGRQGSDRRGPREPARRLQARERQLRGRRDDAYGSGAYSDRSDNRNYGSKNYGDNTYRPQQHPRRRPADDRDPRSSRAGRPRDEPARDTRRTPAKTPSKTDVSRLSRFDPRRLEAEAATAQPPKQPRTKASSSDAPQRALHRTSAFGGFPHRDGSARLGFAAKASIAGLAAIVLLASGLAWTNLRSLNSGIAETTFNLANSGADGATDILLVGLDSRTDAHGNPLSKSMLKQLHASVDDGTTNTDTIILVRIPNNGNAATAISIPRDSYVQVPGIPGKVKINSAYGSTMETKLEELTAKGESRDQAMREAQEAGRQALIDTVQNLTGAQIDRYAEIGLLGFDLLTDAVGGVKVCLKHRVYDKFSGADFPAGVQTLNGAQALSFVRQRHNLPRGDLDRIVRQQVYMASLAHKVLSTGTLTDPSRLAKLEDAIKQSVVLSAGWNVEEFASQLKNLAAGNIKFSTIPVVDESGWSDDGRQSVVIVDPTKVREWVKSLLGSKDGTGKSKHATVDPSSITVNVTNAGSQEGLANGVSRYLTGKGYAKGSVNNDTTLDVKTSEVLSADDNEKSQAVAKTLGGLPVVKSASIPRGQVRVVLTDTYAGPGTPYKTKDTPAPANMPVTQAPPISAGADTPKCVN